ncbi:hypothetical protein [Sinosporangium album]|nr:hypothetical protein [Sinosporangium album]
MEKSDRQIIPDLAQFANRPWQRLNHREALADLVRLGWIPCGIGDWAVAVRSPDGRLAARVCPFDPAYEAFLELCRRCPGNPYLPDVAYSAVLDGGATIAVLDHLAPAKEPQAAELARQWNAEDGAPEELDAVRRAAQAIDGEYRTHTPWWDGIDLNENNVRQRHDGHPVVIDVFCMDGEALYGQILKDASVVRERMGEARTRHVLDIPYIARESTPEEIETLRRAWGQAARPQNSTVYSA